MAKAQQARVEMCAHCRYVYRALLLLVGGRSNAMAVSRMLRTSVVRRPFCFWPGILPASKRRAPVAKDASVPLLASVNFLPRQLARVNSGWHLQLPRALRLLLERSSRSSRPRPKATSMPSTNSLSAMSSSFITENSPLLDASPSATVHAIAAGEAPPMME